jgi:hypothetical protein
MRIWNFGIIVNGLDESIITMVSAKSIDLELTEPAIEYIKVS